MARKRLARTGNIGYHLKPFLERWQSSPYRRAYGPKATIFAQGDPSDAVYYVVNGRVVLTVVSRQGREATIATLNSHTFFGEACLIGQPVRPATARTATPCTLLRIPKRVMKVALRDAPAFSEYFVAYVLTRNQRIEDDLVDQLFNSSEKRLARTLLLLAHFGKNGKSETVMPRVTQATLANMIGTTRERVSHFLNKFRRLGLIEYNGELRVHSSLIKVIVVE